MKRKHPWEKPDPEPAEIAAMCAEIQAGWSELERQARQQWQVVNGSLVRPNLRDIRPLCEIPEVRCA